MTYVPTPTYIPHVSSETQELAHKIEHVIREYQQSHPGVSDTDVSQAVQMAVSRTGASAKRSQMTLALVVGMTVLAVLGSILFWQLA